MTPATILVTGGAGFIGSNFVRAALRRDPPIHVVNLDALTYAGNLESLDDVSRDYGVTGENRYRFVHGDIRDAELLARILTGHSPAPDPWEQEDQRPDWIPDAVVHFAAESHVDRSILGPAAFVETNVTGTLTLLEACRAELRRKPRPFRFVHVSTDEVYGSLGPTDPPFSEHTALAPNSPYAASKAASDFMVRAYVETHHFPAIITRCSNNYGPFQFPEKLIPLMITRALRNQTLPVYGDGRNVRDWVHVLDHVEALWTVLIRASPGEVYNIGGEAETTNIAIVQELLRLLGKPQSLISYVTDRPGHDRRYAMNISRISQALGWQPQRNLQAGLEETVKWYLDHSTWWERVLNEAYRVAHALYLTG